MITLMENCFFMWILITIYSHSLSNRKSFSISCKSGLLITNYLSFSLPWNVFSPSFLKDHFADYKIVDWQGFTFNTLNISSHCLWPTLFLLISQLLLSWDEGSLASEELFFSFHIHNFTSLSFASGIVTMCLGVDYFIIFSNTVRHKLFSQSDPLNTGPFEASIWGLPQAQKGSS